MFVFIQFVLWMFTLICLPSGWPGKVTPRSWLTDLMFALTWTICQRTRSTLLFRKWFLVESPHIAISFNASNWGRSQLFSSSSSTEPASIWDQTLLWLYSMPSASVGLVSPCLTSPIVNLCRLTGDDEEEERQCNYERYRILVHNECTGCRLLLYI